MQSLEDIFEAFNKLKVLVIGDVMIDSYLWGSSTRQSPEAPVPVVNVEKRETRLGGAANVALNVQALGATPIICSIIGEDLDGDELIRLMDESGLSTDGILKSVDRITTIKHRIIANNKHQLRVDSEDDSPVDGDETRVLLSKINSLLDQCDAVIFEDYDKGVITEKLISHTIAVAKENNIPVVVDPKKRNFLAYKGATLFKPNLKELAEGLNISINKDSKEEISAGVQKLKEITNIENFLITLSENGVYLHSENEDLFYPVYERNILDVSGAGDTVVSVAGLCSALRLPGNVIACLSNLSGGLVCENVGVVPIDKQKLLEEAIKHNIL